MEARGSGGHPGRRADALVFAAKASAFRLRRAIGDRLDGGARRRPQDATAPGALLSEVRTPLYGRTAPEERELELGKVQNLRIGARAIDGTRLQPGEIFSFWAQLGRPTRAKGYVIGRELRQGCLIPTIAGGLCQLSNALFTAARRADCEILERHGHTAEVPGSPFPPGEDATVFWNYVDLRFRSERSIRLCAALDRTDLRIRVEAL